MKKKELLAAMQRIKILASRSMRIDSITETAHLLNKRWVHPDTEVEVSGQVAKDLDQARASATTWWRKRSSSVVAYWLPELSAAVQVSFSSRPSAATATQFGKELAEELRNAANEYRANHDQWTGCLNKAANDQVLLETVSRSRAGSSNSSGASGASDPASTAVAVAGARTCLLALDLDHFKTINDRFGHLYGDIVLRVFSARVDLVCATWAKEIQDQEARITFSRPGGEEFQVLVEGAVLPESVLDLAERIRRSIGSRELPTDSEYESLLADGRCDSVELPPAKDRAVTVSIGVSTLSVESSVTNKDAVSRLQRDADRSLYSAKSSGRDCVRVFSDLLRKFGRVVANHQSAGLVAIDIGSDVGVTLGQEFLVFPPEFIGGVSYVVGEGRSKKRIGEYPRYAVARISVVEVQSELSFCKVESWNAGVVGELVPGSLLEAIPLGSISHLISRPDAPSQFGLLTIEAIRSRLNGLRPGVRVPVVGLRIYGLRKYAKERGFAAANRLLAEIYGAIAGTQGEGSEIASVSEDGFVFVPNSKPFSDSDVSDLVDRLTLVCVGKVQVGLGVFDPNDFPSVKASYGVELGLLAASCPVGPSAVQASTFSDAVVSSVLASARISGNVEAARADMQKLQEIGLKLPLATNQFGLIEYVGGNFEQAAHWFLESSSADPTNLFARLNLGLAYFEMKDWARSYEAFRAAELDAAVDGEEIDERYLGAYLVSARKLEVGGHGVERADVARILNLALESDAKYFFGVNRESIERFSATFAAEQAA